MEEAQWEGSPARAPHVQFVAPRGAEGRVAVGAAGPRRKSGLVPMPRCRRRCARAGGRRAANRRSDRGFERGRK